jgi:hypothetical protein
VSPTAYPLAWPFGQKRTAQRRRAPFGKRDVSAYGMPTRGPLTVADAIARLDKELRLIGARDVVVSTNLALRLDGRPRSDQRAPEDPGVAVYFTLNKKPHVLPCDTWDRVADNIAGVAKYVVATRGIERWGVGSLERAFAGYLAIPARTGGRGWREVLDVSDGVTVSLDYVEDKYRKLARVRHPDAGGSEAAMAELNVAISQARQELRGEGRP